MHAHTVLKKVLRIVRLVFTSRCANVQELVTYNHKGP
jgi:hypothetical protein